MHVSSLDTGKVLGTGWNRLLDHRQGQARFFNLLNRMLFGAVAPAKRWNVFARFYRLPTTTIERFYAMDITMADRLRLVVGRPPAGLSLLAALGRVFR
jgi:lycopene beta-cyclase